MSEPVNLETSFPAYRIRMSADHVKGSPRDPWNFEIPCSRWKACIYPHGGTKLQALVFTHHVKAAISKLQDAGAAPWQVGDFEATVIFEAENFQRVATVLRPKLKRVGAGRPFARKARETDENRGQSGGNDPKVDTLPGKGAV